MEAMNSQQDLALHAVLMLGQRHTAQCGAGADADLRVGRRFRGERSAGLVRVVQGHFRGHERKLRESIQPFHAPRREICHRIEIGHLAGDLGVERGWIEVGNPSNA